MSWPVKAAAERAEALAARLPGALALVAMAMALIVLAGWLAGVEALESVLPGYARMRPLTAIGLALAGACLASLGTRPLFGLLSTEGAGRLVKGLSGVILVLGAVTLLEYAAGLDLGFESAFLVGPPTPSDPAPGRMSVATALNFVLLATAFLLWRRNRVLATALATTLGAITFVSVLGYLYGIAALFSLAGFSPIALNTVAVFLILFFGLLMVDLPKGPFVIVISDTAGGVMVRRLLPAAVVVPLAVGYLRLLGQTAGYYDTPFGAAMFATALTAIFAILILSTGRAIDRLDRERLEADEARTRAAAMFGELVEAAVDGIFGVDRSGKVQLFNREAERMFGFTRAEIMGRPIEALIPERFHGGHVGHRDGYNAAPRSRPMGSGLQLSARRKDGSEFPVEISLAPVETDQGLLITGFVRDVTARRKAEEVARESETRFSKAFHASPVAMTITDQETGAYIDLNKAAESLLGYTRAETLGKTSAELGLLTPEARKALAERYEKQGRAHDEEIRMVAKGGVARTVLASGEFIDYSGRRALLAVLVDITERKRAEEAVRESRESLAQAQRIGHVGSWDWDVVRDVARWSDELFRIFGVPPTESALGYAQALSYIHPEDRDRFASDVKDAVEGKGSYDSYYRILRGGTELRHLHAQGEVVRSAEGQVVRMIGFVEDITERKQAEEAIRKSAEELAANARDLARSNAELEQFAYVASHDLQEPLRMISSYLQLLETRYKGKLDADADDFIRYGVDGAKRMQALINDLLALSRVGTRGKAFEPVESGEALSTALQNLEIAIEEAQAKIEHGPLPRLAADPGQLTQLFQNLVGNAIKFRGEAPPEIYVSAQRDGAAWRFTVKDNGIGIDPTQFERIFIVFQRLHGREEYPGTGIGLAISKKIVERHGGRIWVQSQPGQGTAFHFTIPDKNTEGGKTE